MERRTFIPRRGAIALGPDIGDRPPIDVPVWQVVFLLVLIEASQDAFAWSFLGPDAVKWTATRDASEALIQGIPQNAVGIGLTVAIASWLGWWRGLGLRAPKKASLLALFVLLPTAAFAAIGTWRAVQEGAAGAALILGATTYYVVQPAGEELVFRGLLLHGLRRRLGDFGGVLLSSALFALAHFVPWGWPPTARSFLLLFGFGVVSCAMRIGTGSIWYPIVFHGVYNMMGTTYGWLQGPTPEYAAMWYWSRSIRVFSVIAMLGWLLWIVLVAWQRLMQRLALLPVDPWDVGSGQPTMTRPRMPKS